MSYAHEDGHGEQANLRRRFFSEEELNEMKRQDDQNTQLELLHKRRSFIHVNNGHTFNNNVGDNMIYRRLDTAIAAGTPSKEENHVDESMHEWTEGVTNKPRNKGRKAVASLLKIRYLIALLATLAAALYFGNNAIKSTTSMSLNHAKIDGETSFQPQDWLFVLPTEDNLAMKLMCTDINTFNVKMLGPVLENTRSLVFTSSLVSKTQLLDLSSKAIVQHKEVSQLFEQLSFNATKVAESWFNESMNLLDSFKQHGAEDVLQSSLWESVVGLFVTQPHPCAKSIRKVTTYLNSTQTHLEELNKDLITVERSFERLKELLSNQTSLTLQEHEKAQSEYFDGAMNFVNMLFFLHPNPKKMSEAQKILSILQGELDMVKWLRRETFSTIESFKRLRTLLSSMQSSLNPKKHDECPLDEMRSILTRFAQEAQAKSVYGMLSTRNSWCVTFQKSEKCEDSARNNTVSEETLSTTVDHTFDENEMKGR